MSPQSRLFFIPNSVTAANIVVGFVSMLAAADGRFKLAVYLLVCAVLLDMSDGLLARKLHVTSKFGQEMDSLSDSLSFCAAPAFLVHQAILQPLGGFGVAVAARRLLPGGRSQESLQQGHCRPSLSPCKPCLQWPEV